MHIITRGVVAIALLTAGATALTGCSTDAAAPSSSSSSSSSSSASATASASASATGSVDFGAAPERPAAPPCTTLLPTDLVTALVPGATVTDPLAAQAHVDAAWAALPIAGGTDCWATNGVSQLDSVLTGTLGAPRYEGVVVSVLPRAAAAFEAATTAASQLQGQDVVGTSCDASDAARVYCVGNVRAQNAWVHVSLVRVQDDADADPERMQGTFSTLVERIRSAVATSAAGTQTGAGSPDARLTPCSPDRVNAVTASTLRWENGQTEIIPWLAEAANTRVGGAQCVFTGGTGTDDRAASYSSTPRAGWYVQQRIEAGLVSASDRVELPGLGEHDGAWRTCDSRACTIDVVHGGTWTQYFLAKRVAPDTSAAIERWAASSFRA